MKRPADKPRAKDVGMREVAELAGVAPMTVSRALRAPGLVSAQTRLRIEEAIAQLNYVPNLVAGALSSRKSHTIAVIVPNISNSVFALTLEGLNDGLKERNYQIMIGYSGYSLTEEEVLVRTLLGRRPDALVVTGHTHTPRTRSMLGHAGIPIVEMWSVTPKPIDMAIGFSNFEAARTMTKHIAACGYRKIGFIGGLVEGNDRTQQREEGFKSALKEMKMAFDPDCMIRAPFDFEAGGAAIHELFRRCPHIDAVFAAADIIAIGILLESARQGWSVPGKFGLAGFDDTPLSRLMNPAISTVRVPQYEIGQATAKSLLAAIDGHRVPKVMNLGFDIIQRGSLRTL